MWPKVYVPRPAGIGWPVFHLYTRSTRQKKKKEKKNLYTRSTPLGKAPKVCNEGGDDVDVVGEDDVAR